MSSAKLLSLLDNPPTGWLRFMGTLKLQVSFAKEPYERDDILQMRLIILRSLLIVATPYCSLVQIKREHE